MVGTHGLMAIETVAVCNAASYGEGCIIIYGAHTLRGRRMQGGYEKNHDFRPISRFNSEMMQDRAIVTMESE